MNALSIGVPYDLFWHLTPKKLGYFFDAHQKKLEEKDLCDWRLGIYIQRAVAVAVEHNLAGDKAKSEYFDKPLSMMNTSEMSEEEIDKQTDLLFTALNVNKLNWELEKSESDLKES